MAVRAPATRPPVQDSAVGEGGGRRRGRRPAPPRRAHKEQGPQCGALLRQTDRGRGPWRRSLRGAGKAEALGGGRFHADLIHRKAVISAIRARIASRCGPTLGASQMRVRVEMADGARHARALARLRKQELVGARALPLRVAGRKVGADIALAQGAEDGVGKGVKAYFCVRMPVESLAGKGMAIPPSITWSPGPKA